MPTMLRESGKAKKIANKILRTPKNQQQKHQPKTKKIDKALRIEETKRVR